jgi:phosphohistidine phosphatase SixA
VSTNIRILLPIVTLSLSGLMPSCATSQYVTHSMPGTTTTIVLTRHGDRDNLATNLNEKGRARAEALVTALSDMKVTAIYCPDFERNLETARPLAEKLGIEINIVPEVMVQVVTTMLTEHPGEVVLWVGNKPNLVKIYSLLGG